MKHTIPRKKKITLFNGFKIGTSRFSDPTKRIFDPNNRDDLLEFKYFNKHNHWKNGCPFILQWPWVDVPSMCRALISNHYLNTIK